MEKQMKIKTVRQSSRGPMVGIAVASLLGIFLSVYAYYVEMSAESDPTFKAFCDISARMSCSKVFTSRYGKGFGVVDRFLPKDHILNQPNSVYGMINYLLHGLLAFNKSSFALGFELTASAISLVVCVYLGYILVMILEDFCVVCVSTYVINIVISACCVIKYREITRLKDGTGKQKILNGTKKTK